MGKISVNVNRENPYFGRPLHTATALGRIEIVQYRLGHGADPTGSLDCKEKMMIGSMHACTPDMSTEVQRAVLYELQH